MLSCSTPFGHSVCIHPCVLAEGTVGCCWRRQIRLVLPKVLVACISLAATASATPIRVALDSAEKKADAYGWGHQSQLVRCPASYDCCCWSCTAVKQQLSSHMLLLLLPPC
jgi:hypothetical protein